VKHGDYLLALISGNFIKYNFQTFLLLHNNFLGFLGLELKLVFFQYSWSCHNSSFGIMTKAKGMENVKAKSAIRESHSHSRKCKRL